MGRKRKELEAPKNVEFGMPGGGYSILRSGCAYCGKLPPYHTPTCPKGIQQEKAGG